MQVSIDVKDYHQGTAPVAIRFADLQDNTVEFVHGETVTCDGTYLKYDSAFIAQWIGYGSYVGEVQRQAPDQSYTFVYTALSGPSLNHCGTRRRCTGHDHQYRQRGYCHHSDQRHHVHGHLCRKWSSQHHHVCDRDR